jgi:glycosyltransferase involved in cell wall biosynthesis
MTVLYFHQYFTLPTQAGGTRSYEMARQLINSGHSVIMVCGEAVKLKLPETNIKNICRGTIDDINIIQISLPYSNNDNLIKRAVVFIKFAWKGIWIALTEKYDLLFATSTPLTAGIPGIVAKVFRRKKFVFEIRDLWPELPKALGVKNPVLLAGMSLLEWTAYHKADACIGLSPGICTGIKKRSRKGKYIKMIPNGCDLEIFNPRKKGQFPLYDAKPTDTVAVFTGAHGIANGLDAVLDAAAELKKKSREDIILVFIGDGKKKSQLIARTQKEGLGNCRFYDQIPKMELGRVMASADIGLMILSDIPAFYYGTSPNKFFDYIASGLPVINNYPGWLADMIQANQLGIVVPPNDPIAFADGLIALADNIDYRKQAGINAREFAEKYFSRKCLSNELVVTLEDVGCNTSL